ncbi:UDP-2,4-diacetamido-2,4,6-trideoxy-beta-L-altropyranose hydrolase [Mucilaginibacter sp. McL0603]|uniref:UDP-2,4-diacetamido-2,4, 6-trideoxy-beta-L-altropyranose hydrolase n=1 Tax=Mucilaginibacter sp. McL0603 TaxID=3415670 RepID=UPI003CEC3C18
MKKNKILIRVDGSTKIGLGHLVRCIALAQMLKSDFDISFVCIEIPSSSQREIKGLEFNLIIINKEEEFLLFVNNEVIVVLDHYGADSNYQKNIKNKGCKLVCIDDLHDKVFFADLIINHAPNVVPSDYMAQVDTQFALGLDYVLLRPAFLKKAKETITYKSINTAFICFGGADVRNITQTTVDILKNDARFKKIIIVTGAVYNYLSQLEQSISNDKRFFSYNSIDSNTMTNLIEEAQLAIVPASGILQEVLAIGCKVVSGMYVENQKNIFENYRALEAFQSAENFSDTDLIRAIDASFKDKSTFVNKFIDGRSGERLLRQFIELGK